MSGGFQPEPGVIRWRLHFASPPAAVYAALATSEGRRRYWAESADEENGRIRYRFLNGIEDDGEILERAPERRFAVAYFGMTTVFDLTPDGAGGTDMSLTVRNVPDAERTEFIAGWVSWLMAMKAAVDFDVDLRNHDPARTWVDGFADN